MWDECDPVALAREVVNAFADQAVAKRIELLAARPRLRVRFWSTKSGCGAVLENLVDNALKYTPEGGRVEVVTASAVVAGDTVTVCDNGPGIPAEHLPRLFERFYRVDKARSRELGGTGLGLAIVKHLAEGMGARVSVTSTVGAGACFVVHLPTRPAAPAAPSRG